MNVWQYDSLAIMDVFREEGVGAGGKGALVNSDKDILCFDY